MLLGSSLNFWHFSFHAGKMQHLLGTIHKIYHDEGAASTDITLNYIAFAHNQWF